MDIEVEFERALRALEPARLLIAFSGGLDSSALLVLAERHAAASRVPLLALHVNHGVHPEADAWERHCRRVCGRLDVALEVDRLETTERSEAALRELRYACFERRMSAGDVLLTGHHRDDLAETLLLNLLRGAGVHGLAALPARRALGPGHLLRPLTTVPRAELLPIVRAAGFDWVEDPTNRDTALNRNFIRHRVLPLLGSRWPGAGATLARAAVLAREAAELLDESLARDLEKLRTPDPEVLSLEGLLRHGPARRSALLRAWLNEFELPLPSRARLAEGLRQLGAARADAGPRVDCGSFELRRYRRLLYLWRALPPIDPELCLHWRGPRVELPAAVGALEWRDDAGAAVATEAPPLEVRFTTAEKRLKPRGQRHHRPFKLLFQEAGLPPWERARCPLIHADGRLLALGDLYWTDQFDDLQQRLGARCHWHGRPLLDPPAPVG